ncbi:MAG: GNAT family N-acetyltransferase [Pseudomonadales bacterium]
MLTGYLHPLYAASLAEFGDPRQLPHSGGWILERAIPGTDSLRDGMGPYPLFCCSDWKALRHDLQELSHDLVSLALVTDPFGDFAVTDLENCFDKVTPFKQHFVADLSKPVNEIVSKRHRSDARRSLRKVAVEVCDNPCAYLEEWMELFGVLEKRHQIKALRTFSKNAFATQLRVPGLVMFKALLGKELVGLDLWYVQDDVAQGHLAAFSPAGYETHASYATKWTVIEYFKDKVSWINFGGAPGNNADHGAGLQRFKRGWANTTHMAYFCAKVLNPELYSELDVAVGSHADDYFPSYRRGEFL